MLLEASAESLTWTLTIELAGPSGKWQTKLPPVRVVVVEPTCVPLRPQSVLTTLKVSVPGSLTVKLYVWSLPSLAVRSLAADNVTVGATLLTVTVIASVLLLALSESLTWTLTIELAGPSGKWQTKLPPEAVTVVVPTWLPFAPQ